MNGGRGATMDPSTTMPTSIETRDAEAGAAAVSAPSPWRPLLLRTVIGAFAVLGLSGIGASSMLFGLDGAHASPPVSHSAPAVSAGLEPAQVRSAQGGNSGSQASVAGSANASASLAEGICSARTNDGRIVLNLANVEDLRKLPGIGPKRAEAILALRAKLKRFKRTADLLRVRGIGPRSLARMQSMVVLDPPAGSPCAESAHNGPPK